jgi:hypothetical protein
LGFSQEPHPNARHVGPAKAAIHLGIGHQPKVRKMIVFSLVSAQSAARQGALRKRKSDEDRFYQEYGVDYFDRAKTAFAQLRRIWASRHVRARRTEHLAPRVALPNDPRSEDSLVTMGQSHQIGIVERHNCR